MPENLSINPDNLSNQEIKSDKTLDQSIDEIWESLDLRHPVPKTEEEIENLPLSELFPETSPDFWEHMSPAIVQRLRDIYLQRMKRGIISPPKIDQALKIAQTTPEEISQDEDKLEDFLSVLESYIEARTHPRRHLRLDQFIENFYKDKEFTLVDMGCSKGYITERIARKLPNANVIGIDIFFPPGFTTQDKKARYIQADLLSKHLPVDRVDCFLCTCVWEHLSPEAAKQNLRLTADSLKENGLIIEGVIEQKTGESGYMVLQKKEGRLRQIDFIPYKGK